MKTFTTIEYYPEGTWGHDINSSRIFIIDEDPKRPNLYRMGEIQTKGNNGQKEHRYSVYFGKCNQSKILELSKDMIEVL